MIAVFDNPKTLVIIAAILGFFAALFTWFSIGAINYALEVDMWRADVAAAQNNRIALVTEDQSQAGMIASRFLGTLLIFGAATAALFIKPVWGGYGFMGALIWTGTFLPFPAFFGVGLLPTLFGLGAMMLTFYAISKTPQETQPFWAMS